MLLIRNCIFNFDIVRVFVEQWGTQEHVGPGTSTHAALSVQGSVTRGSYSHPQCLFSD